MKYILKKDLPTFKAGIEARLSKQGNLVSVDGEILTIYSYSALAKFPNILTEWFEPIPKKRKAVPALNDNIYLVSDTGGIRNGQYGIIAGSAIASQGNWRWTQEEAEAEVAKRAAIERVRRYLVENDLLEEDKEKGYLGIYIYKNKFDIDYNKHASRYSPYGRIKIVSIAEFIDDCREDLLLIHS